ncbi:MAG: hypothetical protein KGZ59_07175 [Chitinophagaceae bacterium]|nr:hypothetical protein [Chitinophagaceae bacterium]
MILYDYIITGSGASGLSLLYKILNNKHLSKKNILVIDSSEKINNDRTWCFWENQASDFESIVFCKWNNIKMNGTLSENNYNILPYQYKMIRGIDFYEFVLNYCKSFQNISFLKANVLKIENLENKAIVTTSDAVYSATYVFNSIVFNTASHITSNSLLQHFKGIEIETEENNFESDIATFMDFNIPQTHGHSFVYVLPINEKRALVEYTVFSKSTITDDEYNSGLVDYIKNNLQLNHYKIIHEEKGVIPMTDYVFPLHNKNIINIGTAAGWVKASSGFAFSNIQKRTKQIVSLLAANKSPIIKRSFNDKKFHFYDSVLLEVLSKNKLTAEKIFTTIFKKNPSERILRFLNNETSVWEDLKIMSSVPTSVFLPTAFKKIIQHIFTKS